MISWALHLIVTDYIFKIETKFFGRWMKCINADDSALVSFIPDENTWKLLWLTIVSWLT